MSHEIEFLQNIYIVTLFCFFFLTVIPIWVVCSCLVSLTRTSSSGLGPLICQLPCSRIRFLRVVMLVTSYDTSEGEECGIIESVLNSGKLTKNQKRGT